MLSIRKVEKQQTLTDFAITHYGNEDAVLEILQLNPELSFVLGQAVAPDTELWIDENSLLRNELELKKLAGKVVATATNLRWHNLSNQYFTVVESTYNKVVLYKDMVALDRLVRDLLGEPNALYTTFNQLNRFGGLYPMLSGDENVKARNLITPGGGYFDLAPAGAFPNIDKPYYVPVGLTHAYKIDSLTYEADLGSAHMSAGLFCMSAPAGNLMGCCSDPSFQFGFALHVNGTTGVVFAPTGMDTGTTYAEHPTWLPEPGLVYGDCRNGDVSVWHNNTMLNQVAFDSSYVATPVNPVTIGTIDYMAANDAANKFSFAFWGKGFGLDPQGQAERKAFLNAVHYFLYQRGVLKTFTPFV